MCQRGQNDSPEVVVLPAVVCGEGVAGVCESCLDVFDGVGFFADDGVAVWGEVGAVEDAACTASTGRTTGIEEFVFGVASVFADDVGVGLHGRPKVVRFVMVVRGVCGPGGVVQVAPLLVLRDWAERCDQPKPLVVGVIGDAELVDVSHEEKVGWFDLLVPGFADVPGCEGSQQERCADRDAGDRCSIGPCG